VNTNFDLRLEDAQPVTLICQLADGLPWGIELAAFWARVMSIKDITRAMEHRMEFLPTTVRDVPKRHRSIHAVFDHSWNLLAEEERRVLQQPSVFRLVLRGRQREADATLPFLSTLMDKSRVRRNHTRRFDLRELICQHSGLRLESNEQK
jgi:predicted ATPase